MFGFIGTPGPTQMVIFLIIAVLLFGNRLPSVMRSLGKSVTEFKKGVNGIEDGVKDAMKDADKQASRGNDKDSSEE